MQRHLRALLDVVVLAALSALLQVVKKQRRPTAAEEQHGLFDRALRD